MRFCRAWRVAQAFDLAGMTNTSGCPVLRAVCEGREPRTHTQPVCAERDKKLCRLHRYPPLRKTQGRGTLSADAAHEHHRKPGHPPWLLTPANTRPYCRIHFSSAVRAEPCPKTR